MSAERKPFAFRRDLDLLLFRHGHMVVRRFKYTRTGSSGDEHSYHEATREYDAAYEAFVDTYK
jgi:hypothetical protein